MSNDGTMTIQDIKNLPERRSGSQGNLGRGAKCSKFQADMDYYGGIDYSNR